jgi:hypothetical protein
MLVGVVEGVKEIAGAALPKPRSAATGAHREEPAPKAVTSRPTRQTKGRRG